jgi:hypothetical protein
MLDRQLARQAARANPGAPRLNRNGEPMLRTEKMVRLRVNTGWIPRDTMYPLQFARMALATKKVPYVEEISFLGAGRSWAEFFVDERHVEEVKVQLRQARIDFTENFDPMAAPPHNPGKAPVDIERTVIWRRALIRHTGRFQAIREAALDGIPEAIQVEIRELATRMRNGTSRGWKWPKPARTTVTEQQVVQGAEILAQQRQERRQVLQAPNVVEAQAVYDAARGGNRFGILAPEDGADMVMEEGEVEPTPSQC